jgi:outer membrane scaffolding protein for murein synthesis (MipA/OmpV family)
MGQRIEWRALWGFLVLALIACAANAQTPSPLLEWQYSGGIILERVFEPTPPDFHAVVGLGAEVQPAYEGSRAYKVRGGPALDIRYRDLAFVSTGDGIGYNVIRRRGLELGLSIAYDSGRKERLDYGNLRGMGDKPISAVPKVFVAWVVSDRFPVVVRADVRQLLRSGGGTVGDFGFYLPTPGSSERIAFFVGPAVTVASRHYLNDLYGVTASQSMASGHPIYDIHDAGVNAYGVGLMATWRLTRHYLLNFDGAVNRLGHETLNSPIVERASSHVIAVSIDYHW